MVEEARDDSELTDEQRALVDGLTHEQVAAIDSALLANVPSQWRKVAFVVGKAMGELKTPGIPDVYYAERVRVLVDRGLLESAGNLRRMRFSEIRRRP